VKRYVLPAVAALAAVGGAVALVVIAAGGGAEPRVAPPTGDPVEMETSVTPSHYLFGDALLAEIRLSIDRTRVDPATVVSVPVFRPFQRVGPVEIEQEDLGDRSILHFRYPLQCVARGCVPDGDEKVLDLPLGFVRYTPRRGDNVTLPLSFPSVTVETRLSDDVRRDIEARPATLAAQAPPDELPELPFRGGPSLLGWLLVGAAAAILLALGGWLAWRLWPRRVAAEPMVTDAPLPPVPAALALVEGALAGGEPERRIALDELARRLRDSGETELADEATRLAWSEDGPQRDSAAQLAAAVRGRVNGDGA
jgi:hypothetical protein